jgi:hypothetical protein
MWALGFRNGVRQLSKALFLYGVDGITRHGGRSSSLLRSDKRDSANSAVTVRHFDPPTLPAGDVVLFQIVDDLEGLLARRLIVGQNFGCFSVVEAVAVVQ